MCFNVLCKWGQSPLCDLLIYLKILSAHGCAKVAISHVLLFVVAGLWCQQGKSLFCVTI